MNIMTKVFFDSPCIPFCSKLVIETIFDDFALQPLQAMSASCRACTKLPLKGLMLAKFSKSIDMWKFTFMKCKYFAEILIRESFCILKWLTAFHLTAGKHGRLATSKRFQNVPVKYPIDTMRFLYSVCDHFKVDRKNKDRKLR